MAISTVTNRVTFQGDGTSAIFAFGFQLHAQTDLSVFAYNSSAAAVSLITPMTLNAAGGFGYTLSGNQNPSGIYPNGVNVVVNSAPNPETILIVFRSSIVTNSFSVAQTGTIPATGLNNELDYLTLICQRLQDQATRSARLKDGYFGSFDPTLPAEIGRVGSSTIIVNGSGTGWAIGPTADQIMGAQSSAIAAAASATAANASAASAAVSDASAGSAAFSASLSADRASAILPPPYLQFAVPFASSTLSIGFSPSAGVGKYFASQGSGAPIFTSLQMEPGSVAAPGFAVLRDTTTGLASSASSTMEVVAGGFAGLQVKKSTGSFANVGLGGAASTSDQVLLSASRSNASAGTYLTVGNTSTSANAFGGIQVTGDNAQVLGAVSAYTAASTIDAYISAMVIRAAGTATKLSLAAPMIKFYTNNAALTTAEEALRLNADFSMQIMQTLATPTAPTSGVKLYKKADERIYLMNSSAIEQQVVHGPFTQHGVLYASSATQFGVVPSATAGYVLTANGSSAPSFQSLIPTNQVTTVSAAYTQLAADGMIIANSTNYTIMLVSLTTGKEITVQRGTTSGSSTVTIAGSGGITVGGVSSIQLPSSGDYLNLFFDGSNYRIKADQITSYVHYQHAAGRGSAASQIFYFNSSLISYGNAFTAANDSTNGASATINLPGKYSIEFSLTVGSTGQFGLSLNAGTTTGIASLAPANVLNLAEAPGINQIFNVSWSGWLAAGDVVRPHSGLINPSFVNPNLTHFQISRL